MGNFSAKIVSMWIFIVVLITVGIYFLNKNTHEHELCCVEKRTEKELNAQIKRVIDGDYSAAIDLASYYSLMGEEEKFLPWMRVAAASGDIRAKRLLAEELLDHGLANDYDYIEPSVVEGFVLLKSTIESGDPTALDSLTRYENKYKSRIEFHP